MRPPSDRWLARSLLLILVFFGPGCFDEFGLEDGRQDSPFATASDDDSAPADDGDGDGGGGDDDDDDDDDAGGGGSGGDDDGSPDGPTTTLVTIDDTSHQLLLVDEVTGEGTPITAVTPEVSFCSTVFTRDGSIYVSSGGSLWLLDACSGEASSVGSYSPSASICGIATNNYSALFGIDRSTNDLVSINSTDASLSSIGWTGVEWGTHGLTWDDKGQRFLGINGGDDRLYAIDKDTGEASLLAELDQSFATVGVEMDPISGELYACTEESLLVIDVDTGEVTKLGEIYSDPSCDDLGATWMAVPCID